MFTFERRLPATHPRDGVVLMVAAVTLLLLGCSLTTLTGEDPASATPVPTQTTSDSESSPTAVPLNDAATPTSDDASNLEGDRSSGTRLLESEERCGDGVCDGPETSENCTRDCGPAADDGEDGLLVSSGGTYWVRNPTSGVDLFVQVVTPASWDGVTALPALVVVPGGSGAGSSFLVDKDGKGPQAQLMADAGSLAIVIFDPDGRGKSMGTPDAPAAEDDGGFVHQDGLAAVIRYAAQLPEIDGARMGIASVSYGVTMATGALARYPDLPILFLIDREGPADRNDTGGCDAADTGHLQGHNCDDEAFWAEREAATFARSLQVPYQRLQSRDDHAQPDLAHTALMLTNATAQAHGGEGVSPWTRLNKLTPNTVYSEATLPELPPSGSPAVLDSVGYARELFDQFGPEASPASGAGNSTQPDAPLYLTTMTHMEGNFIDDRDRAVFDTHVAQLRYGLALASEYDAKFTVESEMPFARACAKWGLNMMQEVLDLGHGVGTHADVGFNNPPPNVEVLAQELLRRKVLVDALVGPAHNRGVSGAGGVNDWVLAAHQAGFSYVDGVVGMHYLAMPLSARPDGSWTDQYIRTTTFHDPAPVDFAARIEPFMMRDACDFEPDPDGVILLSSGEIGRLDVMAEGGSPVECLHGECPLTLEDVTALEAVIADAAAVRDPARISKLTLYLPAKLFVADNEVMLRAFLAKMQALATDGTIVWATQGDVCDAYLAWQEQ